MSTSDQQGHGPLTRRQLREIRLTGSTPVITPEEAAAAAAPSAPPVPSPPPVPRPAEPAAVASAPEGLPADAVTGKLTRRQLRELERMKNAGAPGSGPAADAPAIEAPSTPAPLPAAPSLPEVASAPDAAQSADSASASDTAPALDTAPSADTAPALETAPSADTQPSADDVAAELGFEPAPAAAHDGDVLADVGEDDEDAIPEGERPTVNPAFGSDVLTDRSEPHKPFTPSFDELLTVGDSTGSHHVAPSALIFTQNPGEGSLSGPVAATGEVLITGSYELPRGIGSQGHAHGTADGREVDAVLIDGELPAASSPMPIAASSAVSTIKPAGEVIRPPAPEKGNKLMLTLAITAGGLALALAVALVVAFTTNVF